MHRGVGTDSNSTAGPLHHGSWGHVAAGGKTCIVSGAYPCAASCADGMLSTSMNSCMLMLGREAFVPMPSVPYILFPEPHSVPSDFIKNAHPFGVSSTAENFQDVFSGKNLVNWGVMTPRFDEICPASPVINAALPADGVGVGVGVGVGAALQ